MFDAQRNTQPQLHTPPHEQQPRAPLASAIAATAHPPAPEHNHLLALLPAQARNRLRPHLDLVYLSQGKVLHAPGETLRCVYFPTDAIVTKRNLLHDGALTEVLVVGNDGLVGLSLITGDDIALRHAVVQCAGYAYRLASSRLVQEVDQHGELLGLLLRYTQVAMTQIGQNVVCNRHHTIEQQLCRWLLQSLDRLPCNQLHMTHEAIASLLGVRREGITEAAGKLQKLGLISYRRGRISVLDRRGLERLSCECYAVVRRETDRLLPYLPAQHAPEFSRRMNATRTSTHA